MAHLYSVSTGHWTTPEGLTFIGYSGFGSCRNDPETEALPGLGPIPRGRYAIGDEEESAVTGKVVMRLVPVGHDAHGRSGFEIHGDSREHPGRASHGCIILDRSHREAVSLSGDRELEVIA